MSQIFTLEQANRALCFVRPIAEDLRKLWVESNEKNILGENVHPILEKIEYALKELQQVGSFCRDIQNGIMDFPGYHNEKAVFFCWKLGENEINHWHGLKESFKDRQHLSPELTTALP